MKAEEWFHKWIAKMVMWQDQEMHEWVAGVRCDESGYWSSIVWC